MFEDEARKLINTIRPQDGSESPKHIAEVAKTLEAKYDAGYSDGESSCLADFNFAFDELTDIEVEGAWQTAEAVNAALASARRDALMEAAELVKTGTFYLTLSGPFGLRGLPTTEEQRMANLRYSIAAAIEALSKKE